MVQISSVAVFCGSSDHIDRGFIDLAAEVGQALAHARITMVYGGGHSGLMGAIAQATMESGGNVTGVIPDGLFTNGIDKDQVTRLEIVDDMHERKARMYELADGFIGLPGGFGTFEEVFEAATWTQLGLHTSGLAKTVVLLDHDDFWAPVHALLDRAAEAGFMSERNRAIIRSANSIDRALQLLSLAPSREAPDHLV